MERRKPPYRDILVCYDGYRQIGWRTKTELEELLKTENVNWYKTEKEGRIDVDKHIGRNILVGQGSQEVKGEG